MIKLKCVNFYNFLKLTYKKRRISFYTSIIFFSGIIGCAILIGQSIPPFYIFAMFSYPFPNSEVRSDSFFRLYINHKEYNTFLLLKGKGDNLRENVNRYIYLKNNNYKDKYYQKLKNKIGYNIPEVVYSKLFSYQNVDENFKIWIKNYLETETGIKINSLKLYQVDFKFNSKF